MGRWIGGDGARESHEVNDREQNFRYFDRNIGEISVFGGDR